MLIPCVSMAARSVSRAAVMTTCLLLTAVFDPLPLLGYLSLLKKLFFIELRQIARCGGIAMKGANYDNVVFLVMKTLKALELWREGGLGDNCSGKKTPH